jgi:hypothetical protein
MKSSDHIDKAYDAYMVFEQEQTELARLRSLLAEAWNMRDMAHVMYLQDEMRYAHESANALYKKFKEEMDIAIRMSLHETYDNN